MNQPLSTHTLQSYHTQGFYTWQSFLTPPQLLSLRVHVNTILSTLHSTVDPEWIQHVHQLPSGKWMLDFASSIKHIAAHLLNDPTPILYSSQIAVRSPGSQETTPWHQDGPGANVCTFWIALDRVDEHNGGLQVIPGGHTQGRLSLKKVANEQDLPQAIKMASHNVYAIIPPTSCTRSSPHCSTPSTRKVPPTVFKYRLRAGGAGVHHDSLPHRATSNSTTKPRRVIILRFMNHTNEKKNGKFVHYKTGEYITRNYIEI